MERTFLVTIIVGLVLIMFSESIIYSWVGEGYSESIAILRILLLGTFTVAINKPISYFFTAQLNYKYLYVGAATTPGVFILSLLLLVPSFGLVGFAIAKTLAVFSSSLVAIIFVRKVYQPLNLFKIWHRELVIVTFSLYMITRVYSLLKLSVEENSMLALIAVFISITLVAIILIFILFLYSKRFKNIFRDLIATRRGIGDHSNLD